MSTKNKCIIMSVTLWGGLGFIRGVQSYNFNNYNTHVLYTDKLINGLFGSLCYLNPTSTFFMVYKEVYRLEVNLFNIKIEKESNFYNKLIF